MTELERVQEALRAETEKRQQAEAALRESEKRFQLALKNAPLVLYNQDRELRFTWVGHFYELPGLDMEAAIGRLESEVLHGAEAAQVRELKRSVLETGISARLETPLVLGDEVHVFDLLVEPVRDAAGTITGISCASLDITKFTQARDEIRQLNEDLERRVADRTRELTVLYNVTFMASQLLDPEVILQRSLALTLEALGGQAGYIYLLDEKQNQLRLATHFGLPENLLPIYRMLPMGTGLNGWVAEHGQPLLVPDIVNDPRTLHPALFGNLRAYVGAPLRTQGRTIGTIGVLRVIEQGISTESLALLTTVADQIGTVVESARLRQQARQTAVLEERQRLARELHDSVSQALYTLANYAAACRDLMAAGKYDRVTQQFDKMEQSAQQALREMRLLIHALRPSVLEREGLAGALQQRLDAVEGHVGLRAQLLVNKDVALSEEQAAELYGMAQEALNNVIRHARATAVTVRLDSNGQQVIFEVVDNGQGFEPDQTRLAEGMGMTNLRERALKLGGELSIVSRPGEGTRVRVAFQGLGGGPL